MSTHSTDIYNYFITMGRKMERDARKIRKLESKVSRLRDKVDSLKAQRGRVPGSDADVPETDIECPLVPLAPRSVEPVLLTPLFDDPERPATLSEWRRAHELFQPIKRLDERFSRFLGTANVHMLEGSHILITNMGPLRRLSAAVIQDLSPVAHILSAAAGVTRAVLTPALRSCIHLGGMHTLAGGVLLGIEETRQIVLRYHVPCDPGVTWSYLIPSIEDVQTLRSVLAYAHQ